MRIYLCRRSALRVMRHLRGTAGVKVWQLARGPLGTPSPAPYRRWVRGALRLESLPCLPEPSPEQPLEMAVPSPEARVRTRGVRCVTHGTALPGNAFMQVGEGVWVSSPELLFLEMAPVLSETALALLGYELCGTYSRPGVFGLEPATTTGRLHAFLDACNGARGVRRARRVLAYVRDDAWSPMESVLALLSMQGIERAGYGIGSVTLNRREQTQRGSRVPDIMFDGTRVGINYDGMGHFDLQKVADAARRMEQDPGSAAREEELRQTMQATRAKLVDDARRNRELRREGLVVFPAYYEDLAQEGALDLFMDCVMSAIEQEGARDFSEQRRKLRQKLIAKQRQQHVWAMLGGKPAAEAKRRYQAEKAGMHVEEFIFEDGRMISVQASESHAH